MRETQVDEKEIIKQWLETLPPKDLECLVSGGRTSTEAAKPPKEVLDAYRALMDRHGSKTVLNWLNVQASHQLVVKSKYGNPKIPQGASASG